jgi:hypothetical protein
LRASQEKVNIAQANCDSVFVLNSILPWYSLNALLTGWETYPFTGSSHQRTGGDVVVRPQQCFSHPSSWVGYSSMAAQACSKYPNRRSQHGSKFRRPEPSWRSVRPHYREAHFKKEGKGRKEGKAAGRFRIVDYHLTCISTKWWTRALVLLLRSCFIWRSESLYHFRHMQTYSLYSLDDSLW